MKYLLQRYSIFNFKSQKRSIRKLLRTSQTLLGEPAQTLVRIPWIESWPLEVQGARFKAPFTR